MDDARQARELRADPDGHDRAADVLALAADVEHPAPEREADPEAGQHERDEVDQGLLQVERGRGLDVVDVPREPDVRVRERDADLVRAHLGEPVQPGALEDRPVGADRVAAGRDQDDHASDQEGEEDGEDRNDDAPGLLRERVARREAGRVALRRLARPQVRWRSEGRRLRAAHVAHAAAFRPPPVIATPSSSSATLGGNSPTISPSNMTRIRSESERISSSSSETSRIARPSSRSATSRRWTYSIAPTSRPRVGWAAISTFGLRATSRATTTFCWLPPESAPPGVFGPPPRTSKSLIS